MSKKITAADIRQVREETGAPMLRAKKVLEEQGGDVKKATVILREEGFEKVGKRAERETSQGVVVTYAHHTGKVAAIVEFLSETDFVAKNELFTKTANEIALQVASMNPKDEKELLSQGFIKDPSKTIEDLIKDVITKTGENVRLGRFSRIEVGR